MRSPTGQQPIVHVQTESARVFAPVYKYAATGQSYAESDLGQNIHSGLCAVAYAICDLADAIRNPSWGPNGED